ESAAERDVLAAVVQQPTLVAQATAEPPRTPAVGELLAMVAHAVAQGRTTRADVVRHVFAACAERPDLSAVLAIAIARADEIPDPAAFLAHLQRDRQRFRARDSARLLRQQLQDAQAAGDPATA